MLKKSLNFQNFQNFENPTCQFCSLILFCIYWHFQIVFIFKTKRVTAISAKPYF